MNKIMIKLKQNTAILLMLTFIVTTTTMAQSKPNIVFFMVDDMGWVDSEIKLIRM